VVSACTPGIAPLRQAPVTTTIGAFKAAQLDLQLKPQLNPNSISQFPNLVRVGVQVGVAALNAFYFFILFRPQLAPQLHQLRSVSTNNNINININHQCTTTTTRSLGQQSLHCDYRQQRQWWQLESQWHHRRQCQCMFLFFFSFHSTNLNRLHIQNVNGNHDNSRYDERLPPRQYQAQ
jgi:hypothetical protein